MQSSFYRLGLGMLAAIVLVYLLMAVNFQSWADPFIILSALPGALAGILYIGQLGGATNTLGSDVVFLVYAGVMIGGYSIIRGGVGNPAGGAMGLLVIAGVTDIIAVKSINTYYTDVIVGALLLAAVFFDRIRGGDAYE